MLSLSHTHTHSLSLSLSPSLPLCCSLSFSLALSHSASLSLSLSLCLSIHTHIYIFVTPAKLHLHQNFNQHKSVRETARARVVCVLKYPEILKMCQCADVLPIRYPRLNSSNVVHEGRRGLEGRGLRYRQLIVIQEKLRGRQKCESELLRCSERERERGRDFVY